MRTHAEALAELVAASGTQLDPVVVGALVAEVTRQGLT
jgi:HD-GYP domain-containing protein (c-di-GMP phosphodiesterase class II)